MPLGTVKSRIRKGLAEMKRAMEADRCLVQEPEGALAAGGV
jgi:hypothetical protein